MKTTKTPALAQATLENIASANRRAPRPAAWGQPQPWLAATLCAITAVEVLALILITLLV